MKKYIVYDKKETTKVILHITADSDSMALEIAMNFFKNLGLGMTHIKKHFKICEVL